MGLFQQKLTTGNVLSYHDFRSGSFRDLASTNDGTASAGVVLNREGAVLDADDIDTGSDYIGTGARTIILRTKLKSYGQNASGKLVNNDKLSFYTVTGRLVFQSDASTTTLSAASSLTLGKSTSMSVSRDATGANTNFYVDGILSGTANQDSGTPEAGSGNVLFGDNTGSSRGMDGTLEYVAVFNEVLTNSEINKIAAEIDGMTWTTKVTTRTQQEFPFPSQLVDADMENSGVGDWTVFNAATLTKQTGTRTGGGGKQVLRITYGGTANPGASQAVNTAGNLYRATGYARGDGTAVPRVGDNSATRWTGTSSTDWQYFDVTYAQVGGGTTYLLSTLAGAGYVEFDDVQIMGSETPQSSEVWHTDWGAYETVADVTAGQLSNTPFQRVLGTFKISADTINGQEVKVIENVVAGTISMPTSYLNQTPTEAAYGTWKVWMYKGSGSTTIICGIVADEALSYPGYSGYALAFSDSERFSLLKVNAGSAVTLMAEATSTRGIQTWYEATVTRTKLGVAITHIDGVLLDTAGGAGTNPDTDTAYSTGNFLTFGMEAGDKIAYADPAGNHAFVKNLNVV